MRGLVFDRVDSVSDVCHIVQQNVDKVLNLETAFLQHHYQSLVQMDEYKQEKFLDFVHYVDEKFSPYGSKGFFRQKLFTILAAATYYHEFYDQIANYTDGELSILAKYSFMDSIESYPEILKRIPQDVLSIIESKVSEFHKRDDLIFWYDCSLKNNENQEDLQERLKGEKLNRLLLESVQIQKQIIKEVEEDDSRRI